MDFNEIEEVSNLFNLYRQFYGKESNSELAKDFLKERFKYNQSIVFVAQIELKIVGFAQIYTTFSSLSVSTCYILNDLFVLEEYRNSGIGRKLIKKVEEYSKYLGASSVRLSTAWDNYMAQKLYESRGWKKDDQFINYSMNF